MEVVEEVVEEERKKMEENENEPQSCGKIKRADGKQEERTLTRKTHSVVNGVAASKKKIKFFKTRWQIAMQQDNAQWWNRE